jgi:hypothetical protein
MDVFRCTHLFAIRIWRFGTRQRRHSLAGARDLDFLRSLSILIVEPYGVQNYHFLYLSNERFDK